MNAVRRIAIVGAGPAGIYAAEALCRAGAGLEIDVLDALPAPFGLVRYGVAPDQKIKAVAAVLGRTLARPEVRFLGNVTVGAHLTVPELRRLYDAVLVTTGAPESRRLEVSGVDLPGSRPAGDFVAWYNGHPDRLPAMDLTGTRVAVIGAGNVALDVVRMLVKDPAELARTDVPDDVVPVLRAHTVADVFVVIRRGPDAVRFTPPELRHLGRLTGVDLLVDPADVADSEAPGSAVHARAVDILRDWSRRSPAGAPRRVRFLFHRRPVAILGRDRVEAVRLASAVRAGDEVTLPVDAVFHALGFRGVPVPGLPFDAVRAIVPNHEGRVDGVTGVYVAGWAGRGPSGVIGDTKVDAARVVRTLLDDLPALPPAADPRPESVLALLTTRGVRFVTYPQWCRLDELEIARGRAQGRARAKIADRAEMLDACRTQR
ncbi:ferredoxin--NADP+ reductase [Catenuloplanes nepalensis]|uniref:ferredoxin--NADP(+) reductase n=1 Tax=Catenuloplanes nepalensis TaxID=587533 RepID=A0ABT9MJR2_9ACTN|nr:FAD-dependent oxidoreductase [Catenuloplanes nepalensis]MDP9791666.1 ferredoxin--NADP+ reductase [Catenuloplanes nepalensis]